MVQLFDSYIQPILNFVNYIIHFFSSSSIDVEDSNEVRDGEELENDCHKFVKELVERTEDNMTEDCPYQFGHKIVLAQKEISETSELADLGFGGCCRSICFEFHGCSLIMRIHLDPRFQIDLADDNKKDKWPTAAVYLDSNRNTVTLKYTIAIPEAATKYLSRPQELRFRSVKVIADGDFPAGIEGGVECNILQGQLCISEFTEKIPFNMEYCTLEIVGKSMTEVFHEYLNSDEPEGTVQHGTLVDNKLAFELNQLVDDKLDVEETPDYHPYSNDTIRDIVHPALYAYETGVSPVIIPFESPNRNKVGADRWGRPYEASKYQWLPTYFKVSSDGKCEIDGYINGLDKTRDSKLYSAIESLFERFIPGFECVYKYVLSNVFYIGVDENIVWNHTAMDQPENGEVLRGKDLQVITKIVDYELKPGQSYEGVWHVEGMSHENIVATGLWIAKRDDHITGGEIVFKRAATVDEVMSIGRAGQWGRLGDMIEDENFMIPLGKIGTEKGRALVFPNCHVHKVKKMTNTSDTETAVRRIVVFFLVDPERRVISTREVPDQRGYISLEAAKARRLQLMNERKYHKQTWNLRITGLCEH